MINILKQLRVQHHLSQTEMAEKLYMSQSAYSNLENERTSHRKEIILLMVKEFGSSVEELLSTDEMQIVLKQKASVELMNNFVSKELYIQERELFEKVTAEKEREINRLASIIQKYFIN